MADTSKVNIVQIETKDSVNNLKKMRQEIKDLKSKLIGLDEGTAEYNETLKELAEKQFTLKDINEKATRAMSDTGEVLANISGVASTATSAIGGITSGLQLMGLESEDAEKSMLKLVQLMSVAQSFSAIEDGIDRMKNLKIAIGGVVKGLGTFKTALAGTGIGLAVIALGSLASAFSKLAKETKEAREEYQEYNNQLVDNLEDIELIRNEYLSYGDDFKKREEFILDNASAFDVLGISINNATDAQKVLIENWDKIQRLGELDVTLNKKKEERKQSQIKGKNAQSELDRIEQKNQNYADAEWYELGKKVKNLTLSTAKTNADKDLNDSKKETNQLDQEILEINKEKDDIIKSLNLSEKKITKEKKEQTEELRTQQQIIEQGLVYAETEEDAVDETPKIETGNEEFKYDNQTDLELADKIIAKANEVAETEIEINAIKNEIIVDQEIETSKKIEEQKQKRIAIFKSTVEAMSMVMSASSELISKMQEGINTESKEGFELNKKYEISQATIAYLQGLISAVSSSMQLGVAAPFAATALIGILSATYFENLSKIKSTKFGGSASASGSPSVNTSAVNSLQQPSFSNVRPTFSQSDVEELPMQKTYVLASDIETAINTRKTTVRNSTF